MLSLQQKDPLQDYFRISSVCAVLKTWFNLNLMLLECLYSEMQGTTLFSADLGRVSGLKHKPKSTYPQKQ